MSLPDPAADTGRALRALYAHDGGTGAVFSAKVRDYLASRPDYPPQLVDTLKQACPPGEHTLVADVGAGTGLLTRMLLDAGYAVVAVEPNAEMRHAADALLAGRPRYRSADGSAEQLPVPDASLDLVTAAQAFHWFDVECARAECLRALKPHGQVALVWNDRAAGDPLHDALDALFQRYGGARREALVAHEAGRQGLARFYGSEHARRCTWPHEHLVDRAGLLSLVLSRSYMPRRDAPEAPALAAEVDALFERLAQAGALTVRYETTLFLGQLRA